MHSGQFDDLSHVFTLKRQIQQAEPITGIVKIMGRIGKGQSAQGMLYQEFPTGYDAEVDLQVGGSQ